MIGHKMDAYLTLDNCIGDVDMHFSKKIFKSRPIINRNADVVLFRNSKMHICIEDALRLKLSTLSTNKIKPHLIVK